MNSLMLFDIEGTTTDVRFVHDELFPYAEARLSEFVRKNLETSTVERAITDVRATVEREDSRDLDLDGVIRTLLEWIKIDRKHGALKEIQGLIWDEGYARNDFKGHVYSDVKPFFKRARGLGIEIAIYSSGSVHAQKLIFGYSLAGDLTPYISHFFDTKVGPKREVDSYRVISQTLKLPPSAITFFSDIPEELEAAESAGFRVIHVLRPGTAPSKFQCIKSFDEFSLE